MEKKYFKRVCHPTQQTLNLEAHNTSSLYKPNKDYRDLLVRHEALVMVQLKV